MILPQLLKNSVKKFIIKKVSAKEIIKRRCEMAEKKLVEAITAMEDDFAQWYTDVVKKADVYSGKPVK